MEKSIHGTWKRVLSFVLTFALVITMVPTFAFAETPSETEYRGLVQRLENARDNIRVIASECGEVDFGNGYKVDIKAELENFAANIDNDLGVAAAIVAGNYKDPRLEAVGVNNSNTSKGYTQANYDKAFSDKYTAAAKYLKQGGIAVQSYGGFPTYPLQYFFSYKSKLNLGYSASPNRLGINEKGITKIVEFSENYVEEISKSAMQISALLDMLKAYKAEVEGLETYFLSSPCADSSCDDFEKVDECKDWTHRILVAEGSDRNTAVAEFTAAVNKFKNEIDKDIKITGILATGKIDDDSSLWFGEYKKGSDYYNNTAAKTVVDKMNAAIHFLENGGYTCGLVSFWKWENKLSYSSSFNSGTNGYTVEIITLGLGNEYEEKNKNAVLPLVDGTLSILRSGTTADNLNIVYNLKVNEIKRYIAQVEKLRETEVPEGGTYSQGEYESAIENFIINAERDLYIADILLNGNIENNGYASKWVETVGSLKEEYGKKLSSEKEANAIRFFSEGGYGYGASLLGYGFQLEYKSSFFKDYSSGLFGVAANKADAVAIIRDTAAALELGNKYMTAKELAEFKYNQALNELKNIKDKPDEIVKAVLESDQDLKELIGDLNTILGSLDDIIDALDKLNKLGIGKDIIDPILSQMGLSYDMLKSIAGLRDLLDNAGIDTSGEVDIEESMEQIVGNLVGVAIDVAIGSAEAIVTLKTESAYNTATGILSDAYKGLMNSAASSLNNLLAPIANIVEPVRPYLHMLKSSISLVNRMVTIVEQVNELSDDFTMGGLSDTTYTLSYILDDTADLMTAFGDARLAELLSKLLESTDLGGSAADATAGLLNQIVNELVGQNVGLSGEDLGFIRELIDTLTKEGLKNTVKLVPLLRTTSDILKRVAELEGGIQDIIDKDYESAWNALTKDFGSMFKDTVDLWNNIISLFSEPVTGVSTAMSADTGKVDLDSLEGDVFLQSFAQGINDEATDTLRILVSPSYSNIEKYNRFKEFREFTENVREFVKALEGVNNEIKDACKWAEDNLTKEEAKDFLQKLGRHYVNHMHAIIKAGFNRDSVKNVISQMKAASAEIKDLIRLIKQNGDIVIIATPGNEDVFYNLSTNYDELREKLDDLFKALGINTEYELSSELFRMDGNAVKAADELEDNKYQVNASYRLKLYLCGHEIKIPLATKMLDITVDGGGEEPEPEVIDIEIKQLPYNMVYTVGEELDLDGLKVYAIYDDDSEDELTPEEYAVEPVSGTVLTVEGNVTVTVTYKEITDIFEIEVKSDDTEEPDPELTGIKVQQLPDNMVYTVGEELDLGGLKVYALYDDDSEDELTPEEYAVEPSSGTVLTVEGNVTVTVTYKEFTDTFDIRVNPSDTEEPEKQNYTVIFNANGGSLAGGAEAKITVTSGTAISLPGVAARTNYSFNGWYDRNEYAGNAYDTYIVLRDAELIARWTYVASENPDPGDGGNSGGGGQPQVVEIAEQKIPLAGIYSLLSLDTEFRDGIVYYIDDSGNTVFVPFCFTIGNKVYFLGAAGIDYYVKENQKNFGDITEHWANDSILAIAAREVFQGYPDSSFKPDQPMTRAMLATVLARLAIADTSTYSEQIFDDVSLDTWYGPSVAWAFDNGIVLGVGNNIFNPDGYVTREEIAVMLLRFIKYTEIEMESNSPVPFDDLNLASAWAMDAIDNLQRYGIVTGKSYNKFEPFAETTRGEISTMLYRLIRIVINNSIK